MAARFREKKGDVCGEGGFIQGRVRFRRGFVIFELEFSGLTYCKFGFEPITEFCFNVCLQRLK